MSDHEDILTVTLNPALDGTVRIKSFTRGKEFRFPSFHFSAGGKGLNVSRALKILGQTSLATGCVGGCMGKFIEQKADEEDLQHDFEQIRGLSRINLTILDAPLNATRILETGPHISQLEWKRFFRRFQGLLKAR